ncbi:MAG: lysophospholipid acyltransferase family protein [Panacagrimonas sp.]
MPVTPDTRNHKAVASHQSLTGWRKALRTLRLGAHIVYGLLLAMRIKLNPRQSPEALSSVWFGGLLDVLQLRVTVRGQPIEGARLMVANHISWLDIPVIGAQVGTRFISKADVAQWPVAGWLATAAGTFYLHRGKGGTRPLTDALVKHLRQGGSAVLFPEGTTTDGRGVRTFHARMFAAAVESAQPVQPIAIRYPPTADGSQPAPFIDDDHFLAHVRRLLRHEELQVEIIFCEPIRTEGATRESVAKTARASVVNALGMECNKAAARTSPQADTTQPQLDKISA